jgi:hypothetical protein
MTLTPFDKPTIERYDTFVRSYWKPNVPHMNVFDDATASLAEAISFDDARHRMRLLSLVAPDKRDAVAVAVMQDVGIAFVHRRYGYLMVAIDGRLMTFYSGDVKKLPDYRPGHPFYIANPTVDTDARMPEHVVISRVLALAEAGIVRYATREAHVETLLNQSFLWKSQLGSRRRTIVDRRRAAFLAILRPDAWDEVACFGSSLVNEDGTLHTATASWTRYWHRVRKEALAAGKEQS